MLIPPRSADTTPDAERVQIDLLRAAPVARRLHLALQLTATVIGAARRAIGRAQPHDSPQDRDLRFVDLHYGADVAAGLRKDLDRRSRTPPVRSMTDSDLVVALLGVAEVFEALGVRYYLGGSVASSAHGIARASLDADVVAALGPEHAEALIARLTPAYYVPVDRLRSAVIARSSFNLIHLATMFKIDVFVSKGRPFDREAAARARAQAIGEAPDAPSFPVASPEDTVLAKLEWFRLDGETSERQWWDVVGVLKVTPDVDRTYLRHWAASLGVTDLLDRALADAVSHDG
jgi:hypothetical protein